MMDAPYDRDSIAMGPINKHGIEKSRYTSTPSWWIDRTCLPKKERRPRIYLYLRTGPWKRGEIFPFHPHRSSVYAMKMDRGGKPQSTSWLNAGAVHVVVSAGRQPPFFSETPFKRQASTRGLCRFFERPTFSFWSGTDRPWRSSVLEPRECFGNGSVDCVVIASSSIIRACIYFRLWTKGDGLLVLRNKKSSLCDHFTF